MDITQTKSEGLIREFNLVIPSQEIEKKLEERLEKLSVSVKVDGFRSGKIPMSILKQRYASRVKTEVLEQALQEGTRHIIDKHKLRVALQPKVDTKDHEEGKALESKVIIELLPDIEKVDLSKFKFDHCICKVDDKEVEEALERLRKNHAEFKLVDEKTKAKKGHAVHLAFNGTIAGKPIPGGASEGMDLELGSNTFIPGFEDQLIGLKAGDKKEFDIDFPDDYQAKDLAGKKTHFSIEIKNVKEKALPEFTKEFAEKFGKSSIEELKKAISNQLSEEHNYMSLLDAKRKILDKFAESFKFDIPQGLVDLEFKSIWEQLQKEIAESSPEAKDKKEAGKDETKLKKQYQKIAGRRVLLGLLLAEIGREHSVTVSQKELEKAIAQEVRKYPGMEQRVLDYYRSNTQAQAALRAPIFEDKVIELILQKATINEKQVSFAELKKSVDAITQGDEHS